MVKRDDVYRKFEEKVKELGLKKAGAFRKMMERFLENPELFLFNKK